MWDTLKPVLAVMAGCAVIAAFLTSILWVPLLLRMLLP